MRTRCTTISTRSTPRKDLPLSAAPNTFSTLAWTRGQPPNRHVFQREDGGVWGPSHQQRPLEQASRLAKISPPVTFHVLRHTHASQLAMRGVPMAVIAKQLGHADTRMTEKHYAHLAPNYVADTIRANFPNLGIGETLKVVPLRVAGKRT